MRSRACGCLVATVILTGCIGMPVPATAPRDDVVLTAASQREALLPAGLCGFDDYLVDECSGQIARWAVTLTGPLHDAPRAEAALDRGRRIAGLASGYPFAIDHDDLFAKDAKRRGIAIVVGVFSTKEDAATWRDGHEPQMTELVELATPKEAQARRQDARGAPRRVVVEVVTATPAWDEATLRALEATEPDRRKRELARAGLVSACTVEPGRLFRAERDALHAWGREYAPVQCNGRAAWIPWRSTRLESVVTRPPSQSPIIHQVVDVTCDAPTIEDRPFGARSGALLALGHCPG